MFFNYFLTAVIPSAVPTAEPTTLPSLAPTIAPAVGQTASIGLSTEMLTLIVAVAALVISIVSPIASAWISGYYRLKEKELDMKDNAESERRKYYDLHRAEVIERYINAAGKAARFRNMENESGFGSAMGEIYLYIDESEWPLLKQIEASIQSGKVDQATDSLTALCKVLSTKGVRTKE